MRRITATHASRHVRHRGIYTGTDITDGQPVYLDPKQLRTHLHLMGPTGSGKSRVLLWFFQLLCATNRPIILVDFKGGLFKMARDFALANGYTKRLVLFDLSADTIPGYNPLRENGLRLDLQSQWVAEGVKSAWGQSTFDATPQLARFLYLVLYVSRALTLSLVEGLDVLRPGPALRERALGRIKDPFVHGALRAFHALPDRRKEEVAASTLARLEAFCRDEIVRTVICSPQSLDLETVLTERRILLINFAKYQPLLQDPLKLLARMFTSDLLAHVYKGHGEGKFNEHNPVYFMVDEVQNMATRQLCDALDEGRGIGLHCTIAHQHLSQLALEDESGYLLHSVMNDARTKIIFGDLAHEDLEVLAKNVFIDQYNPWPDQNQLGKTARVIFTNSRSHAKGRAMAWPKSETESTSQSMSKGTNRSATLGISEAQTIAATQGCSLAHSTAHTDSRSRATTMSAARSHTASDSDAYMSGFGESSGSMEAVGSGDSAAQSSGRTFMYDDTRSGMAMIPDSMTTSMNQMSGTSASAMHGANTNANSFSASGSNHGQADTNSFSEAETLGESEADTFSTSESFQETNTEAFSKSWNAAVTQGITENSTDGTSHTLSEGVTPSISEEHSSSESHTIQPLSPEEQTLLAIQKMHELPQATFTLKVPNHPAIFVRAPFVEEPKITKKILEQRLKRVHALPFYTSLQQHQLPVINAEVRALPAQETKTLPQHSPAPDDEPAFWQTTPIIHDRARHRK